MVHLGQVALEAQVEEALVVVEVRPLVLVVEILLERIMLLTL
jgi:hypothetical protein